MTTITHDLTAPVKNIVMDQGSSLVVNFAITTGGSPVDMTGYDLRLQVRRTANSTSTIINCTLANGKLAWINPTLGTFRLVLAALDTNTIRFNKDEEEIDAVYDIEFTDLTGAVTKPCKGSFVITREVTR